MDCYTCSNCQWSGFEDELTSYDEYTDKELCPACGLPTLAVDVLCEDDENE